MRSGLAIALIFWATSAMASPPADRPILIAHRGASADRPEHTLMAYKLAIEQGADYIEPDLVPTKDGHLVARHENEISGTTDVAARPEFAARKTTKNIDGTPVTGWFTEDFTLVELKSLRARERLPQLRPANAAFDGQESIPTLEEILALATSEAARTGRPIGIYPETKHPSYFRALGLPIEERLVTILKSYGYNNSEHPVFIQSFEVENLKKLRTMTKLRLVQLVAAEGGPADSAAPSYAAMLTPDGLAAIARYADAIGAEKSLVVPRTAEGRLAAPTKLVADARKAGLKVHVWTFRPENYFLPSDMRIGSSPTQRGNAEMEIRRFIDAGIDGFFSDSVTAAMSAMEDRNP